MDRSGIERRLVELGARLARLREEVQVADEQLRHFGDEADDARLRALVAETAIADREHREAQKHVDGMTRHRAELLDEIARLEARQDQLLDELIA